MEQHAAKRQKTTTESPKEVLPIKELLKVNWVHRSGDDLKSFSMLVYKRMLVSEQRDVVLAIKQATDCFKKVVNKEIAKFALEIIEEESPFSFKFFTDQNKELSVEYIVNGYSRATFVARFLYPLVEKQRVDITCYRILEKLIGSRKHLPMITYSNIACIKHKYELLLVPIGELSAKKHLFNDHKPYLKILTLKEISWLWRHLGMVSPSFESELTTALIWCCSESPKIGFTTQARTAVEKEELVKNMVQILKPPSNFNGGLGLGAFEEHDSNIFKVQKFLDKLDDEKLRSLHLPLILVNDKHFYIEKWYEMECEIIENVHYYSCHKVRSHFDTSKKIMVERTYITSKDDSSCCICLKRFRRDEFQQKLECSQCKKLFHIDCFVKWFKIKDTCPLCRATVVMNHQTVNKDTLNDFLNIHPMQKQKWERFGTEQKHAIVQSMTSGFLTICGAGGTGKTEVVTFIAKLLNWNKNNQLSVLFEEGEEEEECPNFGNIKSMVFVTPTGKAASNLSKRIDKMEYVCTTYFAWILNKSAYDASYIDCLTLDESSMVGLWDWYFILRACRERNVKRIIQLGDTYQLPPICNMGTLLTTVSKSQESQAQKDLGEGFVLVPLLQNFRVDGEGLRNCLEHLRNVMSKQQDLNWSLIASQENVSVTFLQEISHDVLYKIIFGLLSDCDPSKTRIISSKRTNSPLLDKKFSKTSEKLRLLSWFNSKRNYLNKIQIKNVNIPSFVKGDRVMSTVNVYDKDCVLSVSNGSEGRVMKVKYDDNNQLKEMELRIENQTLKYPSYNANLLTPSPSYNEKLNEMFEQLQFATINTVHKFQGSEDETIICVLSGKYRDFNTLELLYTAASRAKSRLHIIIENATAEIFRTNPGKVFHNHLFQKNLEQACNSDEK